MILYGIVPRKAGQYLKRWHKLARLLCRPSQQVTNVSLAPPYLDSAPSFTLLLVRNPPLVKHVLISDVCR